ncbi:hypothetical protein PoB_005097900 [Plakobranchus ocellatus]|uniref:Uncharacterized protein n=1 Tax=Plakobranchus ocellatus TaxID=259542 RepID=A0AAV4C024_9GAST|nr:hypothetical protein PoB_005097900 [Plakobranchus ocellatus]
MDRVDVSLDLTWLLVVSFNQSRFLALWSGPDTTILTQPLTWHADTHTHTEEKILTPRLLLDFFFLLFSALSRFTLSLNSLPHPYFQSKLTTAANSCMLILKWKRGKMERRGSMELDGWEPALWMDQCALADIATFQYYR